MNSGREWMKELSENCRSVNVKGKDIFFRLPDDKQREAVVKHIALTTEERKAYEPDGAYGWLDKFFVLCCRTAVSSPEFRNFTDKEWSRLIVLTRAEDRVFSPVLELAMEMCGYPKPDDITEEVLLKEDRIAKADEEIGDTPIS